MLWKKPAVVPINGERQDFLEELARQSGGNKQQVQTLLEDYAREKDRTPQRRWSTVPKNAPQPEVRISDSRVEELSKRMEVVEEGMSRLIDTVNVMRRQLGAARPSPDREATARVLDSLAQLIAGLRQTNGL